MQQEEYTYAVARIRYRETRLLSDSDLSGLLSAKDTAAAIRFLRDKGWGSASDGDDPDAILRSEEEKTWQFISEIVPEKETFAFLLVGNDFHNLKVAVKAITRDQKPDDMFLNNCTVDPKALYEAVQKREYESLPAFLQSVAREAMTTLLETSDGQLCDIIIDRACMDYVCQLGKANENEIVRLYCEMFVASSDIRIAVRCAHTHKRLDFISRALAPCDSLDVKKLASAASMSVRDVLDTLNQTEYRAATPALERSMAAFEKWCDDELTARMKSQKWEPFGLGPVVAYIIARQNEIKAVRMILSAKVNNLPEDVMKERLRMMYV